MASRRVTLKEVARLAGVSYQTVSKVINKQIQVSKETEERIEQAIRTLGYRPSYTARSLRTRCSLTIGYSWQPSLHSQWNPILDRFYHNILLAAEAQGYYLLSFPYHADQEKYLNGYITLMDSGRVDGFIFSNVEYNDPRIELLQRNQFPFVAFGRSNPELVFPWVDVDGASGVRQAVEHLIQLNHSKIAILAWYEGSRLGDNRLSGYFSGMAAAEITIHQEWIKRGEGVFDFGYQATGELLSLPRRIRPTAIIALNDFAAVGAMQCIKQSGLRVGKDIAVVGFDDTPMVQFIDPPLTSVQQPIEEAGSIIIPMLIQFIKNGYPPQPSTVLLEPKLVVRKSTTG